MNDASELCCWVQLHAVQGIGPVTFRRLIDRFGTARAAIEESDLDSLADVRGMTRATAAGVLRARDNMAWAERTVDVCQKRGVRILRISDAAYPRMLNDLQNPPPLLYVIGDVGVKDERSVSIVGTTKPSERGRPITEEFARRLALAGVTVVSGYAHGIDAAAHRGAFKGEGRSVLCVPFGIQQFKSRMDFPPLAELAQRGAVVSECPPDREWSAEAAVARDRIIAALGRVVFVVETRPRGGTMHTVNAARQLERPLFALQYREAPESARGNSILIARGATGISKFGEVGELLQAVAAASKQT